MFLVTVAARGADAPVVAVAGISHESNSFNPDKTGLADFGWPGGGAEDFFRRHTPAKNTAGGYIEGAKRYGLKLYGGTGGIYTSLKGMYGEYPKSQFLNPKQIANCGPNSQGLVVCIWGFGFV